MRKKCNEKTSIQAWDIGKTMRLKKAICDYVLNGHNRNFFEEAKLDPVNFSGAVAMFRYDHAQSLVFTAKRSKGRKNVMSAKKAIKRLLDLMRIEVLAWRKNKMMMSAKIAAHSRDQLAKDVKK